MRSCTSSGISCNSAIATSSRLLMPLIVPRLTISAGHNVPVKGWNDHHPHVVDSMITRRCKGEDHTEMQRRKSDEVICDRCSVAALHGHGVRSDYAAAGHSHA